MDTFGLSIELVVPDLSNFDAQRIIQAWHEHAWEINDLEELSVAARTPERTGALLQSLTAIENPGGDLLSTIFYDDAPQVAEWHRVYAQYQEGPSLGVATYTNPPRQMIGRADPEDLPQIENWAIGVAETVVEDFYTTGTITMSF